MPAASALRAQEEGVGRNQFGVDITVGEIRRFLEERGANKLRSCPSCGDKQDFGVQSFMSEDNADLLYMHLSTEQALGVLTGFEQHRGIEQYCTNCGYMVTYHIRPLLDWLT